MMGKYEFGGELVFILVILIWMAFTMLITRFLFPTSYNIQIPFIVGFGLMGVPVGLSAHNYYIDFRYYKQKH